MDKQFREIESYELRKVLSNVVDYIQRKYVKPNLSASHFDLKQIHLKPAFNYGYVVKIQPNKILQLNAHNHAQIHVDYDNELGQKHIVIHLKRGNEEHFIPAVLNGFLTIEQEQFLNEVLDPQDYLNLEFEDFELEIEADHEHISLYNYLDEMRLRNLIEINPLSDDEYDCEPKESVLKRALPKDVKLIFKSIKQRQINNVDLPEIEAQIQFSAHGLKSPVYKVYVDYFQDDKANWLFDEDTLEQVIESFESFYNPIIDLEDDYLPVYASDVRTTEELKKYLKNQGNLDNYVLAKNSLTGFNARLIRLVESSANDRNGSLMADFVFSWEKSDLSLRRQVHLYGFKINN